MISNHIQKFSVNNYKVMFLIDLSKEVIIQKKDNQVLVKIDKEVNQR